MITIYTDGSCLTNPGNGGWAAIINEEKEIRKISGSEKNTTNNRMELLAPINALCFDKKNSKFHINKKKVKNLIKGYESIKKISLKEKKSINTLCRGAAIRYLLTRLYDYSNTPKTALIKIKDPNEYYQKLLSHNNLSSFKDYLN